MHEKVLLDLGAELRNFEGLVQRAELGFDEQLGELDQLEVRLELQKLEHGATEENA